MTIFGRLETLHHQRGRRRDMFRCTWVIGGEAWQASKRAGHYIGRRPADAIQLALAIPAAFLAMILFALGAATQTCRPGACVDRPRSSRSDDRSG